MKMNMFALSNKLEYAQEYISILQMIAIRVLLSLVLSILTASCNGESMKFKILF